MPQRNWRRSIAGSSFDLFPRLVRCPIHAPGLLNMAQPSACSLIKSISKGRHVKQFTRAERNTPRSLGTHSRCVRESTGCHRRLVLRHYYPERGRGSADARAGIGKITTSLGLSLLILL